MKLPMNLRRRLKQMHIRLEKSLLRDLTWPPGKKDAPGTKYSLQFAF